MTKKKSTKAGTKYQGREFQVHIGAPTKDDLDDMIQGLQDYAAEKGLKEVEVLNARQDPDGGWEATVWAHNWNPVNWIREKTQEWKAKRATRKGEEEEEKKYWERQALRSEAGFILGKQAEQIPDKEIKKVFRKHPESRLPPSLRKRLPHEAKETQTARANIMFETAKAGVSPTQKQLVRIYNPETKQWEITMVDMPRSPAEQKAEVLARGVFERRIKQAEREAKLAPVRTAMSFAENMMQSPALRPTGRRGVTPTGLRASEELYTPRRPAAPTAPSPAIGLGNLQSTLSPFPKKKPERMPRMKPF